MYLKSEIIYKTISILNKRVFKNSFFLTKRATNRKKRGLIVPRTWAYNMNLIFHFISKFFTAKEVLSCPKTAYVFVPGDTVSPSVGLWEE